jgi:hypothetical protein
VTERPAGGFALPRRTIAALRVLDRCPSIPVDAFSPLAGLRCPGSAYQVLARLRRAGLAEVRRVDLGYLLGQRRIGLWTTTEAGRMALRVIEQAAAGHACVPVADCAPDGYSAIVLPRTRGPAGLVAVYDLIAMLVAEHDAAGNPVDVQVVEYPWVRVISCAAHGNVLRVTLPAGVVLRPRTAVDGDPQPLSVVLLPDLGTTPVSRYREQLRRLVALRHAAIEHTVCTPELEIVISTPDPDGRGTRSAAWLRLLDTVKVSEKPTPLRVRVVDWEQVAATVGRRRVPGMIAERVPYASQRAAAAQTARRWPAPLRRAEQVLHLVGRHPFLTREQLAHLLGTTPARVGRIEQQLVELGWLRQIGPEDVPEDAVDLRQTEARALGLAELTMAGYRQLARCLGVDMDAARRYHGLLASSGGENGRRRRLLRTLAHTLGANAVFVAFAMAAGVATRQGGADELAEWRSAAACERRWCKPDGYGGYRRSGISYGFLLEYDRGTEPARTYAAKFRAYYRYRDSGQAARDYEGFPTLLFVTTDRFAEERIADAARRAWAMQDTDPLPVLITTTDRIASHREGILGQIWRTPASPPPPAGPERRYWLPGGPPRGLFGAGRDPVLTPRLVWLTPRESRLARRQEARR